MRNEVADHPPPANPVSLRRNFLWTLLGNFAYGGSQWGMIVVLAKMGTPEMVGTFSYGFAITAPVIMFSNLNLRAVLATDTCDLHPFRDYLGLRLFMLGASFVFIALLTVFMGYEEKLVTVIFLVTVAKSLESLSDLLFGLIQKREEMDVISKSLLQKGVLSLTALTLAIYFTGDVIWGVAGIAVAWGSNLFLYDIPMAFRTGKAHRGNVQKADQPLFAPLTSNYARGLLALGALSLPLGFAILLNSLVTNVPRYFLMESFGPRELGIFSALAYVVIVGARVVTALGESASPRLAMHYSRKEVAEFRSLAGKMILMGVGLGATGVFVSYFLGAPILRFLYGPEYAQYNGAFVWIMVAAGFGYLGTFLQYMLTAGRRFRPQALLQLFSLSIITGACFFLVPVGGVLGASVAMTAGAFAYFAGSVLIVRRVVAELGEAAN